MRHEDLFTVSVVTVDGEPLPDATVACYAPLCCGIVKVDGKMVVPDRTGSIWDGAVLILRVRKAGYLPQELVVTYYDAMDHTVTVTMLEDRVFEGSMWADRVITKVQDTFTGLKELLI